MNAQILTFSANEQTLIKTGGIDDFASNTVRYAKATFTLGTNWTGFDSVRAVWKTACYTISTVLDANHSCDVPPEVLSYKAKVYVNLVGSISENGVLTDRLTTFPVLAMHIKSNAPVEGTETAPITASQFEQFVETVQDAADSISDYSYDSEAWAVGKRGGVDVPSTDETYHNNSKYWAEQNAGLSDDVADLKSDISDLGINGEYKTINSANVLPDTQMDRGLWGQTQGTMTVSKKSGSLSNVINYTRTGSSSGTLGIVVPISSLEDGETYRFHIRSEDAHTFPIRIRDNNNGNYGNVNKYLVSDQSMTHTDGDKYHYYDWTFDASELTSGYQYVQIDLKLTATSETTYHFYEPFLGLADGNLDYEFIYKIGDYSEVLEPINLFNGQSYDNSYWNGDGVLTSANKYCCAKPQKLDAGDYIFIVCKQYYGSGAGTVYEFASASSTTMTTKFSATQLEERTVNGLTCALYTFSLSEEKYIATNIGYEGFEADDYMIVRGTQVSDYPASYRYYFEPHKVVKEPTKLNESMIAQTNPIYGKKVAVNGDSICAGAGANGGFIKPIAGHNNMDCSNIGVSGGTITYGVTFPDTGNDRHWVCTSIQNMPQDYDYYIFEGGVNDYANNVPVGSLTTGFPVKGAGDDNIDNTTITGAMEYACRDLVTLFAGKKCGFVFVHGIFPLTGGYATWHTQYKPAMISALEKWGVPYIDLEKEAPPLNLIPSLKSAYTANGDGWHPNEAGYEAFYTDKIEAWMKTL